MRGRRKTLIAAGALAAVCLMTAGAADPSRDARGDGSTRAAIAVNNTRGDTERPCPPVSTSTPFVGGGCRGSGHDSDTRFVNRTPAGAIPFGDCIVSFDVTVAADGRIWLDDVQIGGITPCNDVWACSPRDAPGWDDDVGFDPSRESRHPWRGRLDRSSGSVVRGSVEACVDTCLGRFAGPMEIELQRDGSSWTMRSHGGLGTSGLAIAGEWKLDRASFAVR